MSNPVDFNLYLITDRTQVAAKQTLLSAIEEALRGGVKAVQLREKDLSAAELLPLDLVLDPVPIRSPSSAIRTLAPLSECRSRLLSSGGSSLHRAATTPSVRVLAGIDEFLQSRQVGRARRHFTEFLEGFTSRAGRAPTS